MGWIQDNFLKAGNVLTQYLGLRAINKTGGTLTRGTLVYISGWDTTTLRWSVTKADANTATGKAVWIVAEASVTNDSGCRLVKALDFQGQATNGLTVGDAIYESSTAGGWTATDPSIADPTARRHIIGRVSVVDATYGKIQLDLMAHDATVEGSVSTALSTTDLIALPVYNATGVEIAAGSIVYISSYNGPSGRPTIALADADAVATLGHWVTRAAIPNSTAGLVYKTHTFVGPDCAAAAVGDRVYLSGTAGATTLTGPTTAGSRQIIVGRVKVVATDMIAVDLAAEYPFQLLGNLDLQVGTLSADANGRGLMAASFFDVATTLSKFAAGAFTVANTLAVFAANAFTIANVDAIFAAASIKGSKFYKFQSTEATGTGASQDIAHGLSATPTMVWAMVSDSGVTGIYTLVPGVHDGTNIKFTATTGLKFYVFAV